jgi:hypothetical protein
MAQQPNPKGLTSIPDLPSFLVEKTDILSSEVV